MRFDLKVKYSSLLIGLIFSIFIADTLNALKIININNLVDFVLFILLLKSILIMLKNRLYIQVKVQFWFMIIFIMYVTLSSSFTIMENPNRIIEIILTAKFLIYFPIFLFISSVYLNNEEIFQKMYDSLVNISGLASIVGIIITIYNSQNNIIQEGYRVFTISVLSLGVPLILMYVLKVNYKKRYLIVGILGLLFVILTYSKQYYLSILLIVITFIFFFFNKRNLLFLRLLKILIICICISIPLNYYLDIGVFNDIKLAIEYNYNILTSSNELLEEAGSKYRLLEMKYAFESWEKSPIFGIGVANEYTDFGLKFWVHNSWLWLLLNLGFVGLIIFLLPFVYAFYSFFSLNKITKNKKLTSIISLTGIIIIAFNAFFSPLFFRSIEANILLGLFLATIMNDRYILMTKNLIKKG